MVNKYKLPSGDHFLVYGEGQIPHEQLGLELVESNINLLERPDEHIIPIVRVQDMMLRSIPLQKRPRVRDIVLAEEGIDSFYDLQNAYHLLRLRKLNKSKRIREFVEEKYIEIVNLEYNPAEEVKQESEEISSENL